MNVALCTLFEGSYHIGAAALANSLYASGFRGTLWAGWRGPLPPWASAARVEPDRADVQRLNVAEGFDLAFVSLESAPHFAYYKPEFLERLLNEFAPDAEAVLYLDPDIIVKCPWEIFPDWLTGGVALVEDINPTLPSRHPMRLAWQRVLATRGIAPRRALERYYNSGFVGLPRACAPLLAEWRRMMTLIREVLGAQHHHIKFGSATSLFHTPDQDALNIALMLSDTPINAAGPEAMDFTVGGHYLSHAVGAPKPWQTLFVRQALRGFPPSMPAKAFFQHVEKPIRVFPDGEVKRHRRSLAIGALIGRFYRRT
jgi:hypothetical protein